MTIKEAKEIRLEEYLQSLGFLPVSRQGGNLWYKSPFRQEQNASFKVNTDLNLWYDHGEGTGGNIIALAGKLFQSNDVALLLGRIAEQTPTIRPASFSFRPSPRLPSFQHLEVSNLSSPVLLSYLWERGINVELAKKECVELCYMHGDRQFANIGFPNISGGYEVRSNGFKGCVAPKDISHIRQSGEPKSTCYVFEGFMDYLSFLTIRQERYPDYPYFDWQDYIILNSTANVGKALYPLGEYERIHCLLDNDDAGRKAVRTIQDEYGMRVRDASHLYSGYNDLNDYLCGKRAAMRCNVATHCHTNSPTDDQPAKQSNVQTASHSNVQTVRQPASSIQKHADTPRQPCGEQDNLHRTPPKRSRGRGI